jgi:hypothetical protein
MFPIFHIKDKTIKEREGQKKIKNKVNFIKFKIFQKTLI